MVSAKMVRNKLSIVYGYPHIQELSCNITAVTYNTEKRKNNDRNQK